MTYRLDKQFGQVSDRGVGKMLIVIRISMGYDHSSIIRFLRFFQNPKTRLFTFFEVPSCHVKKRKKRRKRCPGFHFSPLWNC